MPSSTPNYNWPYPISSDDLNAGAAEIGNLATAADARVKIVADAVAAETSARIAADNLRPTSNKSYFNVQYASVATTSTGGFNLGSSTRKFVLGAWSVSTGAPLIIASTTSGASDFQAFYWSFNSLLLAGSLVIALYYLDMPL